MYKIYFLDSNKIDREGKNKIANIYINKNIYKN